MERYYKEILELLENRNDQKKLKEVLKKLSTESRTELSKKIAEHDLNGVKDYRAFYSNIELLIEGYMEEHAGEDILIAYYMGVCNGNSQLSDMWRQKVLHTEDFNRSVDMILKKAHVADILIEVKRKPGIQNKQLSEYVGVKPNYLNEIANKMESVGMISRYGTGKCTYYEITPRMKQYIEIYLEKLSVSKKNKKQEKKIEGLGNM